MIVKRNLSPRRVLAYTAGPLAWAAVWAVVAPALTLVTDDRRWVLPFAPVGALGAALAIFIAFRNNSAFARWNEARAAWQTVLVASRAIGRQVVAATDNAVAAGTAEAPVARAYTREMLLRLVAHARLLAGQVRGAIDWDAVEALLPPEDTVRARTAVNPATVTLTHQSVRVKDGIRAGLLGQFDPIALEPQFAALGGAQGAIERIRDTPTLRQYDYFTRRFVQLFALAVPVDGYLW